MAFTASEETPNLHLPQWVGSDTPAVREDFNQSFQIIDTAVTENKNAISGNTADITTLKNSVNTNTQNIATQQKWFGNLGVTSEGSATNLKTQIDKNTSDIADLNESQTEQDNRISDAVNAANMASTTATNAKTAADEAKASAAEALSTAQSANATASSAKTTADAADEKATSVQTAVVQAQSTADSALSTANAATTNINDYKTTMQNVKITNDNNFIGNTLFTTSGVWRWKWTNGTLRIILNGAVGAASGRHTILTIPASAGFRFDIGAKTEVGYGYLMNPDGSNVVYIASADTSGVVTIETYTTTGASYWADITLVCACINRG